MNDIDIMSLKELECYKATFFLGRNLEAKNVENGNFLNNTTKCDESNFNKQSFYAIPMTQLQ